MIKKLLLGLALTTGLMMANTVKDDLLSLATMGKTAGTALEMNKSDMEKADGGWYIRGYYQSRINIIQRYMRPSPVQVYKPSPTKYKYMSLNYMFNRGML